MLTLVSRSQTFRLTAEGLECIVAFIGQGPPLSLTDMSNNQSQFVSFSVTWKWSHNNRPVCETLRCFYGANFKYFTYFWKSSVYLILVSVRRHICKHDRFHVRGFGATAFLFPGGTLKNATRTSPGNPV